MSKENKKGATEKRDRPQRNASKMTKCAACGTKITLTTQALSCDICIDTWNCINCLDMSTDLYELLQQDNNMKWNCGNCAKTVKNKMENKDELTELMRNMSKQLSRVEEILKAKVDRDEYEELEGRVTALEEQEPTDTKDINRIVEEKVNQQIEEYREREARKLNLIIHNLQEKEADTPEERKHQDLRDMEDVLQEIDCEEASIEDMQRLGQRNDDKPRLVLLKMKKVADKRKVLMSSKKLKQSDSEDKKRIFITPDMSKSMREQNKKLRQELKDRRESGETDLIIRNNKIVHSQRTNDFNQAQNQGNGDGK